MNIGRRHPFTVMILSMVLWMIVGIVISLVVFARDEREFYQANPRDSRNAPAEFGDGRPFYLLIGSGAGFFVGLVIGTGWFVITKGREHPVSLSLKQAGIKK